MQKPIRRLAIVVNESKTGAAALGEQLCDWAKAVGVHVTLTRQYPVPQDSLQAYDACGVVGGDGTLLGLVEDAVVHQIPVFGVNRGKLGFLASYGAENIREQFHALLAGHYEVEPRAVLSVHSQSGTFLALNDAVIKQPVFSHLMRLNVGANKEWVTAYGCDGIIFSTPTGSTAYNLSANGPIVHPKAQVIAMTPICPHTLSNRTLIFDAATQLEVSCTEHCALAQLAIDGKLCPPGSSAFPLQVQIASKSFLLLRAPCASYFAILRAKLKWGEG